ncbi:E3 ubiquitin-protein ligase Topors-like [Salvelinus fontinalis]|uniref:E3 ubiquitin-protein ligase Topors-like n=1 Tax=Salvelinus fontinalis TaxID=8038 RepID=UPI002485199E|nr:E3 ubiquitin-protein ligase Topors-like [Salvelinus fontinalis]XP_055757198.1 E3 ubiquitin-protein ligase Topors-like [Salvelinus fontinalis]
MNSPFQLARMDPFLHELFHPLSKEAFDQLAIYDPPAPTYEDGMTSSTSDTDLSVTSISEEEEGGSEGRKERDGSKK